MTKNIQISSTKIENRMRSQKLRKNKIINRTGKKSKTNSQNSALIDS